jgi:hypothetical protein
MKYLVEVTASIERGNALDDQGGPGPVFGYIAQRFKPEVFYGNPTRRQVFMVVDLPTECETAELMYILTREAGTNPTFTPVMNPQVYGSALDNARKAPHL